MVFFLALNILLNQDDNNTTAYTFKIDRKQAAQEALAFLRSARLGVRTEAQLGSWETSQVELRDQDAVGRYKGYYLTVQHPAGDVTFDRFTGRIEFASLQRQNIASNYELTNDECRDLAIKAVRLTGWNGKLFIDPNLTQREKQYPNDTGIVNFRIQPEAFGVLYDLDHSFTVTIDASTGSVLKLINRAPLPPAANVQGIPRPDAEGFAFQRIAKFKSAEEFYLEDATKVTIVNPPPRISEIANRYREELSDGTGIVAYSVGFSVPCVSGHFHRDPWKVLVDARNGTVVHAIGACLKDLAKYDSDRLLYKDGWPKVSTPLTVQGRKGKRPAFGTIVDVQEKIASDAKVVQLRFPDRFFIAKFDASQNLLQVGSRTGRPTGHLAETLRAVTR